MTAAIDDCEMKLIGNQIRLLCVSACVSLPVCDCVRAREYLLVMWEKELI